MQQNNIFSFISSGIVFLFLSSVCFAQAREEFPYLAEIITEQVNIRAGQNENFEKIGRLKKGEKVVVVDRSFSWDKIKLPITADCFVNEGFIQDLGGEIGAVKGSRVNIRAGRGTQFSVMGSLNKGTLVRIIERNVGWLKIEPIEGIYGWIMTAYLKFVSKEIPPAHNIDPQIRNVYKLKKIAELQAEVSAPEPRGMPLVNEIP